MYWFDWVDSDAKMFLEVKPLSHLTTFSNYIHYDEPTFYLGFSPSVFLKLWAFCSENSLFRQYLSSDFPYFQESSRALIERTFTVVNNN